MSATVVFYTTQTSATASIWRILLQLNRGKRFHRDLGHEVFLYPDRPPRWADVQPRGHLIQANCPYELGEPARIDSLRFLINFRDPRDRLCNSFMWSLAHPETANEPADVTQRRQQALLELGMDQWIRRELGEGPISPNDYFARFMRYVDAIPPQIKLVNTYARLCLDFDSFIGGCAYMLRADLDPAMLAALAPERIENLTGNTAWIGNQWQGSDTMPGRYKRELQPETIAYLGRKYRDVLRRMADLDPDYAELYLENIDA